MLNFTLSVICLHNDNRNGSIGGVATCNGGGTVATKTLRVPTEVHEEAVSLADRLGVTVSEAIMQMTQRNAEKQRVTETKQAVTNSATVSKESEAIQPYRGTEEHLTLAKREDLPAPQNEHIVLTHDWLHEFVRQLDERYLGRMEEIVEDNSAPLIGAITDLERRVEGMGQQVQPKAIDQPSNPTPIEWETLETFEKKEEVQNEQGAQEENGVLWAAAGVGIVGIFAAILSRR